MNKLEKKCTEALNKLIEKDTIKTNLVCVKVDSKGNKTWTRKNNHNKE